MAEIMDGETVGTMEGQTGAQVATLEVVPGAGIAEDAPDGPAPAVTAVDEANEAATRCAWAVRANGFALWQWVVGG